MSDGGLVPLPARASARFPSWEDRRLLGILFLFFFLFELVFTVLSDLVASAPACGPTGFPPPTVADLEQLASTALWMCGLGALSLAMVVGAWLQRTAHPGRAYGLSLLAFFPLVGAVGMASGPLPGGACTGWWKLNSPALDVWGYVFLFGLLAQASVVVLSFVGVKRAASP